LDPQELAQTQAGTKGQIQIKNLPVTPQLVVLVRPDFVIATQGLEALRSFNSSLDSRTTEFASTPFGQRLTEAYHDGTSALMAADLHTILNQIPQGTPQNQKILDRTGFKDAKYAVWEYKHNPGASGSQM